MSDDSQYPECLRRPHAGGHVQTRTAKTEKGYRKRYIGMAKTWCNRNGTDVVEVFDLATDLGSRAQRLSENALKQYHAVIRQHLRDGWDDGAIKLNMIVRIDALLRLQIPRPKSTKGKAGRKTSAGRAKSIKPETLSALVFELLKRPTPIRRIAAAQLEYGVDMATRPGEFLTMTQDPIGRLWIRSAKFSLTNARGLQPVRMLTVDNLAPLEVAELKAIAQLISIERANGATTSSLLSRCQRAIRLARSLVGGRSGKITAYTVRHQSRANMAAMGMTPEQVAVVMNHASAMTAQSHYSPARRAWKGMANVEPPAVDPGLVAKVRPGSPSRGWVASPLPPRPKPR